VKRSEALKIIKAELNKASMVPFEEQILNIVEGLGMLPPLTTVLAKDVTSPILEVKEVDIFNKSVTFGKVEGIVEANVWEPEHE
jgi:hypothetical protein